MTVNFAKELAPMSRLTYRHTIAASYLGYITQAIVNNLAPLLFVTFMSEFSLTLEQITMMTTVNFAVQLLVDLLSAKLVDRIGYRVSIVAAHVLAVLGLSGMAILPGILPPMTGLMIAVVLYAIGGGMIEVLISPIVEACPTEGKSAAMSLLHSFYCWGHVALVLLSTLFFAAFGTANWRVLTPSVDDCADCERGVLLFRTAVPDCAGRSAADADEADADEPGILAADGDDGLRGCVGAGDVAVGKYVRGERAAHHQDDGRFARPVRVRHHDGHGARPVWQVCG